MRFAHIVLSVLLLSSSAHAGQDSAAQDGAPLEAVLTQIESGTEVPPADTETETETETYLSPPADPNTLPEGPPAGRIGSGRSPQAGGFAADVSAPADLAKLKLRSSAVLVVDQDARQALYEKNSTQMMPIASITKLMTAMVTLDNKDLPLDEPITIDKADMDTVKRSGSRLRVGVTLPRRELLQLALMASENRAAAALARTYPGGTPAFVAAMNQKAVELGMLSTRFTDSTGLHSANASTAQDLVKMVNAAYRYDLIRQFTTTAVHQVTLPGKRKPLAFRNSNGLVKNRSWEIGLSKTGYISESGRCLVMQAKIAARSVVIVLLDSWGKYTRLADANRIKKWVENAATRKQRLG